jgi:DNA-binding transcriptional ArsR family regulator
MSVSEIQQGMGISQPETSRHLTVLKNSSILQSEKTGANSYYFLNPEKCLVHSIAETLENFSANINKK